MWRRLKTLGHRVSRDVVLLAMRFVDQNAVAARKRRRLKRRDYASPGPNFCWHIDGYDKLKPFGFAIHGAIDGFSRKMLWLEVGPTNNHPQVTALYFVNTMLDLRKVPCLVRCDRGTENVHIEKIQKFIRRNGDDEFAGLNSFLYGRSTGNQRIEAWWSILRRQCTDFWINKFRHMQSVGLLDTSDPVHVECLRYYFMARLKFELTRIRTEWNSHRIQANKRYGLVPGKPDKLYFLPQDVGVTSFEKQYVEEDLVKIADELEHDEGAPDIVNPDFVRLAHTLLPHHKDPATFDEGLQLYGDILQAILDFENAN